MQVSLVHSGANMSKHIHFIDKGYFNFKHHAIKRFISTKIWFVYSWLLTTYVTQYFFYSYLIASTINDSF